MNRVSRIIGTFQLFLLSSLATPSIAQETVGTDTIRDAVVTAYQSVDRKEVRVSGVIGTTFGDILYFADGTGRYKVKLDAGRDFRRQTEGCEILLFDTLKSPCKFTGMAEVAFDSEDDNIADGIEMTLILYRVEDFSRTEEN